MATYGVSVFAQGDNNESIVHAFSTGNAEKLFSFARKNVNIKTPSAEGAYSNYQAKEILKAFFDINTPSEFKILQRGSSGNANFTIGYLRCKNKTYKILYYTILDKDELIQEIRILDN